MRTGFIGHWVAIACLAITLSGCTDSPEQRSVAQATIKPALSLPGGCRSAMFEGSEFTNCVAAPGQQSIRTVLNDSNGLPLRRLDKLQQFLGNKAKSVVFATNAGMYDDAGNPIGYYVEKGERIKTLNRKKGGGNFHLLPNGVFYVGKDGWHIRSSSDFADNVVDRPQYGTQSGPMLVINGKWHPAISENGNSLNIRNAVGIDKNGRAHFVISSTPVSFGRLARFFRDKLNCPNALYLDGTVSALWYPAGDRIDVAAQLGPLFLVENIAEAAKAAK
jgi:uncharacterized protein YigE (DUF2233 family)